MPGLHGELCAGSVARDKLSRVGHEHALDDRFALEAQDVFPVVDQTIVDYTFREVLLGLFDCPFEHPGLDSLAMCEHLGGFEVR